MTKNKQKGESLKSKLRLLPWFRFPTSQPPPWTEGCLSGYMWGHLTSFMGFHYALSSPLTLCCSLPLLRRSLSNSSIKSQRPDVCLKKSCSAERATKQLHVSAHQHARVTGRWSARTDAGTLNSQTKPVVLYYTRTKGYRYTHRTPELSVTIRTLFFICILSS